MAKFIIIYENMSINIISFSEEDMQVSRQDHVCGTINAQDGLGNKEVVVAGDYTNPTNDEGTLEIYSVFEGIWRFGE